MQPERTVRIIGIVLVLLGAFLLVLSIVVFSQVRTIPCVEGGTCMVPLGEYWAAIATFCSGVGLLAIGTGLVVASTKRIKRSLRILGVLLVLLGPLLLGLSRILLLFIVNNACPGVLCLPFINVLPVYIVSTTGLGLITIGVALIVASFFVGGKNHHSITQPIVR